MTHVLTAAICLSPTRHYFPADEVCGLSTCQGLQCSCKTDICALSCSCDLSFALQWLLMLPEMGCCLFFFFQDSISELVWSCCSDCMPFQGSIMKYKNKSFQLYCVFFFPSFQGRRLAGYWGGECTSRDDNQHPIYMDGVEIHSVSAQTAAFWPVLGPRQFWKGLGSPEPGQGFRNIIEQGSIEQVVFIHDGTF